MNINDFVKKFHVSQEHKNFRPNMICKKRKIEQKGLCSELPFEQEKKNSQQKGLCSEFPFE